MDLSSWSPMAVRGSQKTFLSEDMIEYMARSRQFRLIRDLTIHPLICSFLPLNSPTYDLSIHL